MQRQAHELCIANDDARAVCDQFFGERNCGIRCNSLSVDVVHVRILFGDPLTGTVVGPGPGRSLNNTEMLDGQRCTRVNLLDPLLLDDHGLNDRLRFRCCATSCKCKTCDNQQSENR